MDLNLMINDSLKKMKEEGFVEKVVNTQLQKTIEEVIKDLLREYSPFGKELKEQIQALLKINLDKLDLPSYNLFIAETIKSHLNAEIHNQGIFRLKEQLDEILVNAKEEYTLSQLMHELEEEIVGLSELSYDEVHEMSLIICREYGYTRIYFDAESAKSKYDCKYQLSVDEKTGEVESIRIREGHSLRSKNEFKEFDARMIMGGLYGLEKTLFKMYARKSKLILDEDEVEVEISNPEYSRG